MGKFEIAAAREALLAAKDELLEGRVPGPLTGTRLAEVAGVLRHRLAIDNPDINAEFQARAKELNRTKPEVDILRSRLDDLELKNGRLVTERDEALNTMRAYAQTIVGLIEERKQLLAAISSKDVVTSIASRRPESGHQLQ